MKPFQKFILFIISYLFFYYSCFSQTYVPVPILIEPTDALGSGMGYVGTGVANTINSSYWNPAGLGFLQKSIFKEGFFNKDVETDTMTYFEIIPSTLRILPSNFNHGLIYENFTAGLYIESFGTIALDISYTGYGEITRFHESGVALGKYSSNELSIGFAYGGQIAEDWSAGLKINYIQSNLAPTSTRYYLQNKSAKGYSFDLGVLWKPNRLNIFGMELGDVLSLGLAIKNMGPKIEYRNEMEPLPTQFRFGGCLDLTKYNIKNLKIGFDISKLLINSKTTYFYYIIDTSNNIVDTIVKSNTDPFPKSLVSGWEKPGLEFGIGAEYWYNHNFALRAGYNSEPAYQGNRKSLTFGSSFRIYIFQIDGSYNVTLGNNKYLTDALRISLRIGGNSN